MSIYVKAFVFVMFVYVLSAMPLDGQDDPQNVPVELLSFEEVPDQSVGASDSNDDLTRAKRHGED